MNERISFVKAPTTKPQVAFRNLKVFDMITLAQITCNVLFLFHYNKRNILDSFYIMQCTVGELKDLTLLRVYGVKLP